ncbi:TetR/AcrR family transcriptional regulator [Terriglobus tenax]|uniref:TetR/AcrR family transcriptional regulator n=1 Tax=Terriglobus tenax TaxID=1111115 RepID=UPI0021DFC139|nr:TetR/AcrR family transcriptional regulator [Terriglobus tenax]
MEAVSQSTHECTEPTDPRIRRSRLMLQEALRKLLGKKHFDAISISDIAAEAGLNRATFYLHYTDKNALLQAMAATRFRELLERRGIVFSCEGVLRSLALGVCDYLSETTGCPDQLIKLPLEAAVIPVVEGILREGLEKHPAPDGASPALVAATVAWAMYGAARQWFQTPDRIPAEAMALQVEQLVKPMLAAMHAA